MTGDVIEDRTWSQGRLAVRRAVEALRSGVPSRHSVAALGTGQSEIEDRFEALLDLVAEGRGRCCGAAALLLGGGFGSGKSHLLTHLAQLADSAGFVTSTIVISKETPLHDPVKVLRAAVSSAVASDGLRDVITEAAVTLDPDSLRYVEFTRWLRSPGNVLDERFDATVFLHQRLSGGEVPGGDEEFVDAIVRFWSGDPMPIADLRRQLKAAGVAGEYTFTPIKGKDLARQRLRFLAQLLRAAGHAGWVLLFDEVELIGRYSLLQRGRSYAEMARWIDGDPADVDAPLVAVLSMTDDFEAAVLSTRNDREQVPVKLRNKQMLEYDELAAASETGMRHIEHDMVPLTPPDAAELDRAYQTLKRLHADAYAWEPPDVPGLERLGTTRMRQYVRAWINEWDLVRFDPTYRPSSESLGIASDYTEQDEPGVDDIDRSASNSE